MSKQRLARGTEPPERQGQDRPAEARRRFELWMQRYDAAYGSARSPLTYTLRAQLPIELHAAMDFVVVEVDVMQHEFFGTSGWQRALFLDADGVPADVPLCDLTMYAEGWTLHRYGNGDLLRITATCIITNGRGQLMVDPKLRRFDRAGKRLWSSERIAGSLPNRARDARLFDFDRPLPRSTRGAIVSSFGDDLVVVTEENTVAVIDGETGRRVSTRVDDRRLRDSPDQRRSV